MEIDIAPKKYFLLLPSNGIVYETESKLNHDEFVDDLIKNSISNNGYIKVFNKISRSYAITKDSVIVFDEDGYKIFQQNQLKMQAMHSGRIVMPGRG